MRIARSFLCSFLVLTLVGLLTLPSGGCKGHIENAKSINAQVKLKTAEIGKAAAVATAHVVAADVAVKRADVAVRAAATQPSNPPETVRLLSEATDDHKVALAELPKAVVELKKVAPATQAVAVLSDKAEAVTVKAVEQRDAERDHWVGYKTRQALLKGVIGFGGIALVLGVITFIVKTNGATPILMALRQVGGIIVQLALRFLRWLGRITFTLVTLGANKLADITNEKYEQHEQAKAADATQSSA
jgi:hypothetical protein